MVKIGPDSAQRIKKNRKFLEEKLRDANRLYYGINTGFGSLCNVRIADKDLDKLQLNLIRSHACGMGDEIDSGVVKKILLLKAIGLSRGYSGVRLVLVETILSLYNQDVLPVIYELGSLGASGDLAPLAHLGLSIIGEGEVKMEGQKLHSAKALKSVGITPISLKAKEGLAIINGTQFSLAHAIESLIRAKRAYQWAQMISAISIDAFDCRMEPFDTDIHKIRGQEGQVASASEILQILDGSELAMSKKIHVQDPYSFRCIPQVHGATLDALNYAEGVLTREMNAVTDNPNILDERGEILTGGNFHAQPLALTCDFMALAVAELGGISERRIFKLVSGNRSLPDYLTKSPGTQSGFMIAQYTAASIVSQNKQYCTPASIDSIVSSKGQEDHVSMAANASTKLLRVCKNVERVLAIELLVAAQALECRRPMKSSEKVEKIVAELREIIPSIDEDRVLSDDMKRALEFMMERRLKD